MKNKEALKFKKKYKALRKTVTKVKNKKLNNLQKRGFYKQKPKLEKEKKIKSLNKSTYYDCIAKKKGWTPYSSESGKDAVASSGNSISSMNFDGLQTFSFADCYKLDEVGNVIEANDEENEATKEPETEEEGKVKGEAKKKAAHSTVPLLPVLTNDGWDYPKPAPEEKDDPAATGEEAEPTTPDQDIALPPSSDQDDALTTAQKKQMLLHLAYPSNTSKTIAQLWADQQNYITEKKMLMAGLALNGMRRPIMTKNVRSLIKLMRESSPESEVTIRRFCCLTLAQVFHDQIPGYRMKDENPTLRLKKETYATVKMEVEFMSCYRMYLKTLEETLASWKTNSCHLGLKVLAQTAVFCLGELLALHPHFNYAVNIVQLLVPYLNCKNVKMRAIVSDAISRTFKVDRHNFLTLKIIRRIYRLAQRMHFRVKCEMLQVFLHLPLNNMKNPDQVAEQDKTRTKTLTRQQKLIKKLAVKARTQRSRKEKKDNKKIAKIRETMSEVQMIQELSRDTTRNSDILEKVFGIYFHLLKRSPNSALIPCVLEGLSRYAHLISINYFSDILSVLNGFLVEKKLRKKELLFCIHTVFAILSGQGEDLKLDPHQIYCEFYRILLNLYPGEVCNYLGLILNIIDQMLISRRKKVSLKKVVAFTKRLSTIVLTLPHQGAIPLLICIRNLFKVFNCTKILLESEDAGCSGVFFPESPDPDHSNSESGVVWELILTQRHYHPHIKMLSTSILIEPKPYVARQIYQLTRKSTQTLLEEFDSSKLKFYPPIPNPSTHLFGKKKTKKKIFCRNRLILGDLKLQTLVDEVLHQDQCDDQPPHKKLKIQGKKNSRKDASDDLIDSVDFYPRAPLNEDREEETELKMEQKLDQSPSLDAESEDTIVDNSEQENFMSYFI